MRKRRGIHAEHLMNRTISEQNRSPVIAEFSLDGREPDVVIIPETEEMASEFIRKLPPHGAIVPWGGGHAISQGNVLRANWWSVLSTRHLNPLEEYSPADMVVSIGSGMTLADLQSTLKRHRQWIPIEIPCAETVTIGGLVATNAGGLWRPQFGAMRDRLLGVRVAIANGEVVRGGGRVVKNVAGYDLCKLFAGSWGTLGVILSATLKTQPLPECRQDLLFTSQSVSKIVQAALQIHAQRLQPGYMIALSSPHPILCVGLLGGRGAVAWQTKEISEILMTSGLKPIETENSEQSVRNLLTQPKTTLAARISLPPSELPIFLDSLERGADRVGLEAIVAHVPTGIVEVFMNGERADTTQEPTVEHISHLFTRLLPSNSHLVWTCIPTECKKSIDVWGKTRGDFGLMRAVKTTLDPQGIFSPGRFIARL